MMMDSTMRAISWASAGIMLFVVLAAAFEIFLSVRNRYHRHSRKAERHHFKTLDDKSMRTSAPTDLQ